ncbi:alpha/beta hydrolase [Saccharicrinis sp. FJH2]|uniref:alpha/beta hydrolase n=1 Tax=Saccharicrinis sp. FJH65 TaxID=3344659 RepID=UPI0035F354FA
MKKQIILSFIFFTLLNYAQAQETGVVKEIYLKSPSVDLNILGDTTSKKVLIYLPPSYKDSNKKYPVVYFLTGYGTEVDIIFDQGLKLNKFLDKKAKSGEINEMIMVVATSKIRLNYSKLEHSPYTWGAFYVNSEVTGNWDTFLADELVNYIDSNYRTIPNRESRAITGHSMGGLGAITIGFNHPDIYGTIYSISAGIIGVDDLETSWMFATDDEKNKSIDLINKLSLPNADLNDYKKSLTEFIEDDTIFNGNVILSFAYGSAFMDNTKLNPPYFNYPFERKNGKIVKNNKVWNEWNNRLTNYKTLIDNYKSKNIQIDNIVLEFGTNDNNKLTQGNPAFSILLNNNKIPYEFKYFAGGHGDLLPRLQDNMFPYLSKKICVFGN